MSRDPYEVLGVPPGASPATVRAAYLDLARRYHPDRRASASPDRRSGGDERRMQEINAAWYVLGDPARRAAHDAAREVGAGHPRPPRWRPDGAAHPDFVPFDDSDAAVDAGPDADGSASTTGTSLPRWAQMAPAALLVAGFAAGVTGFVAALDELVALALGLGLLGILGFLTVPLVAVLTSPRNRG